MYLAFGCRRVIFEWEKFGLESFRNDTSLYMCARAPKKLVSIHISKTTYQNTCLFAYISLIMQDTREGKGP